ncbi:transporter substrate-binding domain-containing protein [Chitinivorax sp. B]|uniref:substrate-binding periplasmic protein n=1 Tax=Chitinivorax sp. B TaxID=2502235 RepID=UPI0010F44878|nr:transporter substrate-binding domain-containing protein [Chitinivorax sp. B]
MLGRHERKAFVHQQLSGKVGWMLIACCASQLAMADTVRCVSQHFPPMVYQNTKGEVVGFAVDVIREAMAQGGDKMEVSVVSWSRALELVKQGARDCIFTVAYTPERAQWLDYAQEMIVPNAIYFYARKGAFPQFSGDWAALTGMRVGAIRNYVFGKQFELLRPQLIMFEVSSLDQAFTSLTSNRVDLVPSRLFAANYTLAHMPDQVAQQVVRLNPPLDLVPSQLAFTKARDMSAVRERFNRHMRALRRSVNYRALFDKYRMELTPEMQQVLAKE